jgi:hypothetical protein
VFLFFGYGFLYRRAALGTEGVTLSQSGTTLRAGKLNARLQMLDSDGAFIEIDILYTQG